jgi:AraC-like DNA-binding protein
MGHDDPILATWSSTADNAHVFSVMPDGCRDLIIKREPGSRQRFFISPLMSTPERIFARKGETFIGVRLKPGAAITTHMLAWLPQPSSMQRLIELAYDTVLMPGDVSEMMRCLAAAVSPAAAANELGVSLRTLQRHAAKMTGRTPDFWRRLARARRAARCILSGALLHETAHECHFSDQAHMTRELKNWFAMTPGELAASRNDNHHPAWNICLRGYDVPLTGEHISTR